LSIGLSDVALQEQQNATLKPAFQPGVSSGADIEQLTDLLHTGLLQAKHL
jgi:hypothetical protein